jgi:hypothetical protein
MKNFTIIPKLTYDALTEEQITATQWMVLIWLYQISNPVNGKSMTSYSTIADQFRPYIKLANARKIITALRSQKWIHFEDHKGKGGTFPIYVHLLKLSSGDVQIIDCITGERKVVEDKDEDELGEQKDISTSHSQPSDLYHTFEKAFPSQPRKEDK